MYKVELLKATEESLYLDVIIDKHQTMLQIII